jgi:hypothetical protein
VVGVLPLPKDPEEVDETTVRKWFESCGRVRLVSMPKDRQGRKFKGYALVQFADSVEEGGSGDAYGVAAVQAALKLNGTAVVSKSAGSGDGDDDGAGACNPYAPKGNGDSAGTEGEEESDPWGEESDPWGDADGGTKASTITLKVLRSKQSAEAQKSQTIENGLVKDKGRGREGGGTTGENKFVGHRRSQLGRSFMPRWALSML